MFLLLLVARLLLICKAIHNQGSDSVYIDFRSLSLSPISSISIICFIKTIYIRTWSFKCSKANANNIPRGFRSLCLHYRTTLRFDFLHSFKCIALILDIQNPEILGFSTAHAYKYKNEVKKEEIDIFVG